MSLTIKHLNSDASFLLTFQPMPAFPPAQTQRAHPFTIVLDPWLSGPSKVLHPKFSLTRHRFDACVRSLNHLDEVDLIVISQAKSDHCHRETLTQLPRSGGKTLILAEPAAAKVIRGWKHFAPEKVVTLPKFAAPRRGKPSAPHRIPIPSTSPGGSPGEVTITFLAQKADLTRLHSAVGITYRPPTDQRVLEMTPPATPDSSNDTSIFEDRALSLIHAPHGISYKALQPYAMAHLIPQAAFPLTALLHCFNRVQNPWYLGGNICTGLPEGIEVAQRLRARVWISAHDGEMEIEGLANRSVAVRKYERAEVEREVSPRSEKFPESSGTEAVVLSVGEEMHLVNVPRDEDAGWERGHMGTGTPGPANTSTRVAAGFGSHLLVARSGLHDSNAARQPPTCLVPQVPSRKFLSALS